MSTKQVWLITGAGRGLGVDITKAALAAGHTVVATGRDADAVAHAIGEHPDLLPLRLDITRPEDAVAAVQVTEKTFGRIDVLVNNAGNFYAGFFEELSDDQLRSQIDVLLFGPMNVTRAVLPIMRNQRSGLVISISSVAGVVGQAFCSAYAAGKFGVEGWMESLAHEVAPFGIKTMIVEPGFFKTELLSAGSTTYAQPAIEDYAQTTRETIATWQGMNGKQGGDPAKLAAALIALAASNNVPGRFAAGADAVGAIEGKAQLLLEQAKAHRDLSSGMEIETRDQSA